MQYDGDKTLAIHVLYLALLDATKTTTKSLSSTPTDYVQARMFLLGVNDEWRDSLDFWCDMAGFASDQIVMLSKRLQKMGWPKVSKRQCRIIMKDLGVDINEFE